MLGIPLIADYIHKVVKPQVVADSVDYLNYYCTSLLLAFFAFAISAKQYFGSPIQCWVPMEFRGGWEKYTEDYCFIQNSYYVPIDDQIPKDPYFRRDQLSYYRWVPVVLALQALMFFSPNYIWNMLYKETAISPRAIIQDAQKCSHMHGSQRETEVRNLAEYIADTVAVFTPRMHYHKKRVQRSGKNATFLYLTTKFFYVANIVGQLYMLNHFLGGQYLSWGYHTWMSVAAGEEWAESEVFPRVILCDFTVRKLANNQNYTVQCVIMLNMINEKLYLFLWFWFIFVGFCTLINFFYYLIIMIVPCARAQVVLWNVNKRELKMSGLSGDDMRRFVHDFLRPDGVLVLKFVGEHVNGRISRELVLELIKIFAKQASLHDNDSDTKHTPSLCSNEKAPLTDEKHYFGNYGKDGQGLYHPHSARMYPVPMQIRPPNAAYETAPVLEDYIDGANTLPIGEIARARAAHHAPTNENEYGSPAPRQITPTQV